MAQGDTCDDKVLEQQRKEREIADAMEEKCFKEMYPGDSRKWLLRDPAWSPWDPPIGSTMKDTYRYPEFDATPLVGKFNFFFAKTPSINCEIYAA